MMNKLKIIILIIPILLLCGCESSPTSKYSDKVEAQAFYLYVDDETCVEYYVSNATYNRGNVNPRYNQDGTLKLNKKCLKDKVGEDNEN